MTTLSLQWVLGQIASANLREGLCDETQASRAKRREEAEEAEKDEEEALANEGRSFARLGREFTEEEQRLFVENRRVVFLEHKLMNSAREAICDDEPWPAEWMAEFFMPDGNYYVFYLDQNWPETLWSGWSFDIVLVHGTCPERPPYMRMGRKPPW